MDLVVVDPIIRVVYSRQIDKINKLLEFTLLKKDSFMPCAALAHISQVDDGEKSLNWLFLVDSLENWE